MHELIRYEECPSNRPIRKFHSSRSFNPLEEQKAGRVFGHCNFRPPTVALTKPTLGDDHALA
jgi:hypothetical protein